MKSMMKRTTVREIKNSFGRFFAILAIVALGVGFFAGLKVTKPSMVKTVNEYLNENNLYDFRLISTLGFTEGDVEAFSKEEKVKIASGSESFDILCTGENDNEMVLRAHSLEEGINGVNLKAGRMPEKAGECLADARYFTEDDIGKTIKLTDNNEEDTLECFSGRSFTISGIVDASYYMNFERGTTSLGTGKLTGFVYMLPEAFSCDYYTEVYIKFDENFDIYTQEYDDFIEKKKDEWEELANVRVELRYDDIVTEADGKLADARTELADKKEEADKELTDALTQLNDADQKIADGKAEIQKAKITLSDKRKELTDNEALLTQQEQELNKQEETLMSALQSGQTTAGQAGAVTQQMQEALRAQMEQIQSAQAQIEAGKAQISAGREQIEDGKAQLLKADRELADKEKELKNAEEEAKEGRLDYEEGKAEADEKIAEAQTKIDDAQKEIDDLEKPDYYVLDRYTNIGYACFESDSDIVAGIANIFPIFFFMVAALVCITTMNRMVEEQRTQIGVLKALGYSETAIMSKFMFYSGFAAMLGCILGYAAGTYVFPRVIWTAYGMLYNLVPLKYVFDWKLALISLIVSLLCSMGATWFSCRYELMESAANLMRPKSPKAGKRVFLEYVPFIWQKLKFLHKVTVRNIVRYKKRFFMMVIGISGCTALLLTGFGVKDSVSKIADQQFGEIQTYDGSIGLKDPADTKKDSELTDSLKEIADSYTYVSEKSVDLIYHNKVKAMNLVIFEKPEQAGSYVNLHTVKNKEISYPGMNEAVISNKVAENYRISIGSKITLRDDEMKEMTMTVSGICENFVNNYIYISPDTYAGQIGEAPEYKSIYVNYKGGTDVHKTAAALMKNNQVVSTSANADMMERFSSMMKSLNYVVLLVIACAASLAFIVLYNLTNINITERLREIATIKVLGFYRNETSSYVFRENLVLTGIGGGTGLLLGYFLHRFVMSQINVDMVAFDVHIAPVSYVYSFILTFVFAFIVDGIMSFKLDGINMAESLKSVD